mmetsp:Transcript_29290/g.54326  ORF Transcript_29290/g.54326 Transcript_29290/m.54326 type:complete len:98 (-) Transcript_29290:156-449(-)
MYLREGRGIRIDTLRLRMVLALHRVFDPFPEGGGLALLHFCNEKTQCVAIAEQTMEYFHPGSISLHSLFGLAPLCHVKRENSFLGRQMSMTAAVATS